jgi:hypothetical protein|tara:strand:- start:455 stop:631 length:177 start_codon:yes stop_codon:yes gene_type:complete
MKKSGKLLNQMIDVTKADDLELKRRETKGNGALTVGESWMTFHLKQLRELLKQESNEP